MELALAIATIFNLAAPGIAQIVLLIRKKDGTVAVVPMLSEDDAQFDANLKQAADWFKAHGKTP